MKVTVNKNEEVEPVGMVLPTGDLNLKTVHGKVFLIDTRGAVDHLEYLTFKGEVDLFKNDPNTKLIYPGDEITIQF